MPSKTKRVMLSRVSQQTSGVWLAAVRVKGDWEPLGYFGSRAEAERIVEAIKQRFARRGR